MSTIKARILIEGQTQGPLLKLSEDISLWGGVDPLTGMIIDTRHPQHGRRIAGKILAMHRSIGSSSGSSILLELLKRGCGPLGIVLVEADFIVTLGVLVAREMGLGDIPVLQIDSADFHHLPETASIAPDGMLTGLP